LSVKFIEAKFAQMKGHLKGQMNESDHRCFSSSNQLKISAHFLSKKLQRQKLDITKLRIIEREKYAQVKLKAKVSPVSSN